MRFCTLFVLMGAVMSQTACAQSAHDMVEGKKFPNSADEGSEPVVFSAPAFRVSESEKSALKGFTDLIPFALNSPDQEEAGSCLYMSLTGAAEWWYSRLHPDLDRTPGGPADFSERYLMNAAADATFVPGIPAEKFNWKTDSFLVFNKEQKTVLNSSYRFTKGWYKEDDKEELQKSTATEPGASYGTSYNWINELASVKDGEVKLPPLSRDVIFADPASNQWNVGVMPDDIVAQVKKALVTRQAPVQVIYNHFGYWHSVLILGFDDSADTQSCRFTTKARQRFASETIRLRQEAATAATPAERDALLARAAKNETLGKKLEVAFEKGGGCVGKGAFYVRDSIYSSEEAPMYDYDPTQTGEETHLGPVVVSYEYEWLKYLGNHAIQLLAK